jgi:WD40 repeat protein
MKEDDGDDYGNDFEVVKVHEGVVSCVDVNGQSGEVLSAGYDGSVFIHSSLTFANNNNNKNMNPSSGGSGRSRLHHSTQGAVSYTCAKWCSGDVFLTGTSASHMTLQTWDRRSKEVKTSNDLSDLLLQQNNSSSSSSSYIPHHSSHTILCVDVHPSRPHICCTGHEDGLIALWDLRKENKPVSFNTFRPSGSGSGGATMNNNNNHSNTHTNHHNHHRRRGLGHVWEVKFAPQEALQLFDRTSESLLSTGGGGGGDHAIFACTQDGVLGCTRQTTHTHESNKDSGMMEVLMTENSSIDSFDLDVENLCMICVTGQEGLIYVRDNFSAV